MSHRQKFVLMAFATAYALIVSIVEIIVATRSTDGLHSVADVATVANSIGIPISLLAALLTMPSSSR